MYSKRKDALRGGSGSDESDDDRPVKKQRLFTNDQPETSFKPNNFSFYNPAEPHYPNFYSANHESSDNSYGNDQSYSRTSPVPEYNETRQFSSFAESQMAKMGYQRGEGLGKEKQGISAPIQPTIQVDKKGLGFSRGGLDFDMNAEYEEEEVFWDKKVDWLSSYRGDLPDEGDLNDWMGFGRQPSSMDHETQFCEASLLQQMLSLKSAFDRLENRKLTHARSNANPYEALKAAIFQNRAALKMADIDYATGFVFTDPQLPCGGLALRADHPDLLLFADICAGPGGFTEYITWRKGWKCKGWGLTLKDPGSGSDFQLGKFLAGATESFEPYYGQGGAHGDGDILQADNIREFARYILQQTSQQGVHIVMADGGFSVQGQENLQEVLSRHLILCQILCAMSVLSENGNFLCKLFDCFTPCTVGLVYLTYMCFDSVGIYKPITSRPANSERYLICRGYKGYKKCAKVTEHLFSISDIMHSLKREDSGQDVLSLVPYEQMDLPFIEYMTNSNNEILRQQNAALRKVIQFVKNPNLVESRQHDIKEAYLDKWKVPKDARKARLPLEVGNRFQQLCPGHVAPLSGGDTSLEIDKSNFKEYLPSIHEYRFYFIGSTQNREFLLSQGGEHVHRTTDLVRWSRLDAPYNVELPRDTIIQVEFLMEYKGDHLASSADKALHITDVLMVGGECIQEKSLKDRLGVAEKLAYAVTKPSIANRCRLRVKELMRLEHLEEKLDLLEKRRMRVPTPRTELCVLLGNCFHYECHGIRIVRFLKKEFSMQISKSNGKFYFVDYKKSNTQYHCPPEALASFWDCYRNSAKWVKESGVQLSLDEEHHNPEKLSRVDVLEHINKFKPRPKNPSVSSN